MKLIGEIPPAHVWEDIGFPAGLDAYLNWLESQGADELLWTPEPARLQILVAALVGRSLQFTVVLPNMALYARDAMDSGPTGAVLKRFKALNPRLLLELAFRLIPRAPALLEKRFSAGVMLLVEAELLRMTALPVARVVLHNSVVDMALAFGCPEIFEKFCRWARGRGVEGLFMTYNFGLWAARTKEWGLEDLTAVTPVNTRGYLMQPDRASVEGICKERPNRVWAIETDARAALRDLGITRAAIPWGSYRPETPETRFAGWKKRAEGASFNPGK